MTSGHLSAARIASLSAIVPSRTWAIGDPVHPRAKNTHQDNGCLLEVVEPSLSSATRAMRILLKQQNATLTALPAEIDREFSCIVYIEDGAPELHMNADFVRFAADIGASLDIDVYLMTDDAATASE
jgi:hypothetical protein